MIKNRSRLALRKETVCHLQPESLSNVHGGVISKSSKVCAAQDPTLVYNPGGHTYLYRIVVGAYVRVF